MEASSFRLQDDPAAGVVASDSFSACVERLRAEHGLDHWLLKAKEGPLSYAFNQPDTDAQKYTRDAECRDSALLRFFPLLT